MARIKYSGINFKLFVSGELLKIFNNKKALMIYVAENCIKDYYIRESVVNVRNK